MSSGDLNSGSGACMAIATKQAIHQLQLTDSWMGAWIRESLRHFSVMGGSKAHIMRLSRGRWFGLPRGGLGSVFPSIPIVTVSGVQENETNVFTQEREQFPRLGGSEGWPNWLQRRLEAHSLRRVNNMPHGWPSSELFPSPQYESINHWLSG